MCSFIGVMACLSLQTTLDASCRKQSNTTAQQFEQGDQGLPKTAGSGYPAPARISLANSYDTFVTASYLYWFAGEDGLDVATTANFNGQIVGLTPNSPASSTVYQNDGYHSGFKLGIGYMPPDDDWILRADYTRFHSNNHLSRGTDGISATRPALQLTNWFYQISPSRQQTPGCTHLSSKWHLSIDWLDLVLERPFYAGRRLTVNPFMGLRGSLITQTLNLEIDGIINFSNPPPSATSYNTSHAWAIGPRFGMDGSFLLGAGARFQGTVAGALLYNEFTHVKHHEDSLSPGNPNTPPVNFLQKNKTNLRTMFEASLGLGWGRYFGSTYHLDLSADYEFNLLPEQNQIRVMNDIQIDGVNAAAKSLYLHGLTLTATFNF
jgi:Legionella pneumophila major outer membrane protein precursor